MSTTEQRFDTDGRTAAPIRRGSARRLGLRSPKPAATDHQHAASAEHPDKATSQADYGLASP